MKALWFIGLNIAEIVTIVLMPYYLGMWVHSWRGNFFCQHELDPSICRPYWLIGFLSISIPLIVLMFSGFIIGFIIWGNWEWAKELDWKFRNK